MQKQAQYIIKGMNRDMSISKYPSDHSYENMNVRITQREEDTLLSVNNEKGPSEIVLSKKITGTIIGHCAIRQYIVLFVKGPGQTIAHSQFDAPAVIHENCIYRIEPETGQVITLAQSEDWDYQDETKEVFHDGLFFGDSVQTLGVYESDDIIKVYWVDSYNQNRFINIVNPKKTTEPWYKANELNFVPLMNFKESCSVEKVDTSNGVFAPGSLQYFCTYYNLYGQESAIFFQSDIYYTSFVDRGGKEDESVSNAFKIKIDNPCKDFEYVRIYSVLRTTANAAPQCNIVADLKIDDNDSLEFVDNGTTGENFDVDAIRYMGGDVYSAETLAAKDNTLFTGNLRLLVPRIPDDIKADLRSKADENSLNRTIFISDSADKDYYCGENTGTYPYKIHLDKKRSDITTFKYLERYRFGLQFLHRTGKWSDVVYLADHTITQKIVTTMGSVQFAKLVNVYIELRTGTFTDETRRWFKDNGFIKLRPVVVYPELWDRRILAQGIVCPTIYNIEDRAFNRPFAYSSWYARPNAGKAQASVPDLVLGNKTGVYCEYRHNVGLPKSTEINSEIQCITDEMNPSVTGHIVPNPNLTGTTKEDWVQAHKEDFFVDKSIVTLHSPEIEMGTELDNVDLTKVKFRIVGIAPMTGFDSNIFLSTSTVGNFTLNNKFNKTDNDADDAVGNAMLGPGFYDETIKADNISPDGWNCRMGNINWIDEETHYKEKYGDDGHVYAKAPKWYGFFVYPWHRGKSLNNTVTPDENGFETALLENKIITNARYCFNSFYFNDPSYNWQESDADNPLVSGIKLTNDDSQSDASEVSLVKLPEPKNSNLGELNYYGSVDKIVVPSNTGSKSVGYPIVIAATSRLTAKDMSNPSTTVWEGIGITAGPRAMTNHELFTSQYDQSSAYKDAPALLSKKGKLQEYLPYGFVAQSQNGHTHEATTWNDYVSPSDDSNARRKYWNVSTFDPVRIRFRSTKHAVMAFNYRKSGSLYSQVILPRFSAEAGNDNTASMATDKFFWETDKTIKAQNVEQDTLNNAALNDDAKNRGYLFIGELYRDIDDSVAFGGNSEEALEKNQWQAAGDIVDFPADYSSKITLKADKGDTYYQRYDCLKTFPFTPDEKNSLIETISFMCETRINIDGRYDKNRNNTTKFTITPKNFNLMNPAYNQTDNFFTYPYYNKNRFYPDHFNQIVWSQTKAPVSEIDAWTKLNMASVLDMDGEKGEIVALAFFANELWCFQERGISRILFNSRVQIPVSDGVPIEITNSLKVQGKIYVTDRAGCQNKFAVSVTPKGIYFIDGYNNTISLFDGKNVTNLSDIRGFRQWISSQDAVSKWERKTYSDKVNGFRIDYDSTNQDVYITNDDTCLVFSELLGEFTSFMSYEKTRGFVNVENGFYSLTDFASRIGTPYNIKLWKMFDGEYNVFYKPYGESWEDYYKPFYVQYNVNPEPAFDKIFDNLEFRSDSWDGNALVTEIDAEGANKTFDTLEVENEYQYGSMKLDFKRAAYSGDSTLKKKFRVWRTIMPREVGTRNRIRNTWCKVKLSWITPNTYRTVLHDVVVKYFI